MSKRLSILILILLFTIFLGFDLIYILKLVPIWPDEALWADVANNILSNHFLIKSDLYKGFVSGIENFSYGYPPASFYLLAGWFKIIGMSIYSQRLLSIILSLFFLIIYSFFSRKFLSSNLFSILPIFFLIFDYTFLRSSVLGRPEILVLILGFINLYFLTKISEKKVSSKIRRFLLIACGLLLGASFLIHYTSLLFILTALIYLPLLLRFKAISIKETFFFLIPLFTLSFIWLIYIYFHLSFFNGYFNSVFLIKTKRSLSWIWSVFGFQPMANKLIYLGYFITTWEYINFTLQQKNIKHYLLLLCLLSAWLFSYFYNLEWSFVTITPFIYLSLSLMIKYYLSFNQVKFGLVSSVAILLFTLNFYIYSNNIISLGGDKYSYEIFTEKLRDVIPDNKTIYISAIPDPYFGFKKDRSNNLHQFPDIYGVPKEKLLNILNATDYIIINQSLGPNSDLVIKYIQKNVQTIYHVGEKNQYEADVVHLKRTEERVTSF